jgi:hypothetical protein
MVIEGVRHQPQADAQARGQEKSCGGYSVIAPCREVVSVWHGVLLVFWAAPGEERPGIQQTVAVSSYLQRIAVF